MDGISDRRGLTPRFSKSMKTGTGTGTPTFTKPMRGRGSRCNEWTQWTKNFRWNLLMPFISHFNLKGITIKINLVMMGPVIKKEFIIETKYAERNNVLVLLSSPWGAGVSPSVVEVVLPFALILAYKW